MEYLSPDIACISETHLAQAQDLEMEGYTWYGHNGWNLHIRARRWSGAVEIFIKNCMHSVYFVEIVDKSLDGILIAKLTHKISDYTVLILSCSLPPENSPWGRDSLSYFSHILSQLYTFCDVDAVYMAGDLNARLGELNDFVVGLDEICLRKVIDYKE